MAYARAPRRAGGSVIAGVAAAASEKNFITND
jgi:hypothetical protein